MGESVRIISQHAQDMFYQDYKPADAFLRLEHFLWLCIAADGKLKQDEYDKQVALNLRKRTPNAPINLSADNYITVDADIKNDKAVLPTSVMTFSGASQSLSVTQVMPEGNCGNIMPISQDEKWQACNIKTVPFWSLSCDGIEFINLGSLSCNPRKVKITYIPVLTKKSTVQESRKWAILNMVTIFIKSAKDGVIIDMSADGNSNVATQTEINKYLLKALQK